VLVADIATVTLAEPVPIFTILMLKVAATLAGTVYTVVFVFAAGAD
jgi:hypothetical protein